MMELVDMRDLGSRAVMRWGSSPHARTTWIVHLRKMRGWIIQFLSHLDNEALFYYN